MSMGIGTRGRRSSRLAAVAAAVLVAVVVATVTGAAAQGSDPRENDNHRVYAMVDVTVHDADSPDADEHCTWFGTTTNEVRPSDGPVQLGPGLPGITQPSSVGPFVDTSGNLIPFHCDEFVVCFSDTTNGPLALGEATVVAFVSGRVRVTIPYSFEDVSGTFGNNAPCQDDEGFQYGTIVVNADPGQTECLTSPPSWVDGGNWIEITQLCVTNDYTTEPPVALGGASPTSGTAPLTVTLDASQSHDPDGHIVEYTWEFGDGHRRVTTNPTTSYTYRTPGRYFPLVTVRDHTGLTDRRGLTYGIDVRDGTPPLLEPTYGQVDADLVRPSSAEVGRVATFDASRSVTHGGSIIAYHWDFGDGTMATTAVPTVDHVYGRPGPVTVTVTVENDMGITGDASARFPVFFSSLGDDDGPVIAPSPTTIPLRIG